MKEEKPPKPFNPTLIYRKDNDFYAFQYIQHIDFPQAEPTLKAHGWEHIDTLDTNGWIERKYKQQQQITDCLNRTKDAIYQTIHESKLDAMPPAALVDSLQEIQWLLQEVKY